MKDPSFIPYVASPRRVIATEKEVRNVKFEIKACILSRKGGMPIHNLREEYTRLTGEEIPYLRLGYHSLFHLLRDIPEIISSRNDTNEPVLAVKPNPKTQHLHELIQKQKDPKTYRREPRRSFNDKKRLTYKRQEERREAYDTKRQISSEEKTSEKTVQKPPEDENNRRPIIHTQYGFENNKTIYTEPIVGTSQLFGDDYFLQLCVKYLDVPLERDNVKAPITCGTVRSGLTIQKAIKRLDKIKAMSNKLVINVGTVDIYNRRTDKEMIADYKVLLNKLEYKYGYSPSQLTLCTLPPMGNVGIYCDTQKYTSFASFNNWLRDYAQSHNYKLLDLHEEFTNENRILDYKYFQDNARMVSGTSHPHVLWNYFGRQKAMELILNI